MKKWLVLFMSLGLALALAACGSTENASSDNNGESKKEKAEKKSSDKEVKMGQDIKVGDMVYNIKSRKAADQVGPSVLPEKANDKYLVIEATLKNTGNDKITVDASFFKLKKGKKTYEADSAASVSANQKEDGSIDNSFLMQDLNPDSTMSGKVVFDVAPEVANAKDLKLVVQTGIYGTQKGTISLK
ncbi:DUF4352 domain-containing protein [Bacillus velezensis]|uniref:DUF4352 domain-containing protein n=1 Tax=Bacillus velezensis TaxID=492670 RepID=UPI0008DBA5CA|nr:DUF4352 domain-containing protein [Bacillus velezensis]APA01584.1 hypothetical protein BK055_03090 [Bacillus velezensis]QMT21562.1 DUF4352 domain-containing protein [Bacillus velezensis]